MSAHKKEPQPADLVLFTAGDSQSPSIQLAVSPGESENSTPAPEGEEPKGRRKPTKKAKATKKPTAPKKTASKPKAGRTNKKAEVIALMKRARGATLAEITKVTGWQAHTVSDFVSILGSKAAEKVESSKSADGERTYKIIK